MVEVRVYRNLVFLALSTAVLSLGQQPRPETNAPAQGEVPANQPAANPAEASNRTPREAEAAEPAASITHHKITLAGKSLAYTATTGRMPIKNEQGHIEAYMFYV